MMSESVEKPTIPEGGYSGYYGYGSPAMPSDPLPKKEKRKFTASESALSWLMLFAGYLFCRVVPVGDNPLGGLLFLVGLFTLTAVFMILQKAKLCGMAIAAAVSAVILSFSLIISANAVIHTFTYLYGLCAYTYFVSLSWGNAVEKGFSQLILLDFARAIFYLPTKCLGEIFSALGGKHAEKGGKVLLKVFLGIILAVIPTAVIVLLLSYDDGFSDLMVRIFDWEWSDFFSHFFSILFGIPVGMYLFGLWISAKDKTCYREDTAEKCESSLQKVQILPMVTALVTALPILFVYVVFFISQWEYYVSGFVGALPDATSYAEYARSGFFQLLAVSIINFVLMMSIAVFMKRSSEKRSVVYTILSTVLSVFTLVLIATAIAKMVLYIDRFGLTPKRVYSTWFMILLAVFFVMFIVKLYVKKFRMIPVFVSAGVILFAALALMGTDTVIANYNVDRYFDGTLDTVDVEAMEELGDAAIPALARVITAFDEEKGSDIRDWHFNNQDGILNNSFSAEEKALYHRIAEALYLAAEDYEDGVFSATIPRARAKNALVALGFLDEDAA